MYVFIAKSKSYTEYRKIGRSKKKENRKRKGKYTQSLLLGKMHHFRLSKCSETPIMK